MKIGIVFKEESKKAKEIYGKVTAYLKSKKQQVLSGKEFNRADYIITLGGDGTLIHTACEYTELGVPFVGINTGNLGFLTAKEADDWQKAIDGILKNQVFISERITLEASLEKSEARNPKSETYRAVNEAAIKGFLRIIELEIAVNGEKFLKVLGDGVIVSTQTGSTAYSLSSGGPIVDPHLDCLLITPINPIGLPIPSVVISPDDVVLVKVVKGDDVSLIIDGQEHTKLKEGETIKFNKGKYNVKFGYFDKQHFLKSLNAKFGLLGREVG